MSKLNELSCHRESCKGRRPFHSLRSLCMHVRKNHDDDIFPSFGVIRKCSHIRVQKHRPKTLRAIVSNNNATRKRTTDDVNETIIDCDDAFDHYSDLNDYNTNIDDAYDLDDDTDPDNEILSEGKKNTCYEFVLSRSIEQVGLPAQYDKGYDHCQFVQCVHLSDLEMDRASFAADAEVSHSHYSRY